MQTIPVAPGDAAIVEAKWKYPGTYLFHSHGIQEELGNMGQINVISGGGGNNNESKSNVSSTTTINTTTVMTDTTTPLTESISMFDWQYELQKKLQKPIVINYTQEEHKEVKDSLSESREIQERGEDIVFETDKTNIVNTTDTNANTRSPALSNDTSTTPTTHISMVPGSSNPNNKVFYDPTPAKVKTSTTLTWTNDDTLPHTVTSGNADTGPSGEFDSGIVMGGGSFTHTFDKAGTFDYFCALHPYMTGQVIVG